MEPNFDLQILAHQHVLVEEVGACLVRKPRPVQVCLVPRLLVALMRLDLEAQVSWITIVFVYSTADFYL